MTAHAPSWCYVRRDEEERGEPAYTARAPEMVTCEFCKPRAAKAFAEKRRSYIRQPPRPPFEGARGGICRVCGEATRNGHFRWHADCAALWNAAFSASRAAYHLGELHGYRCWDCGAAGLVLGADGVYASTALYVDHIRPLWSLSVRERAQIRWWLPGNLQLLCKRCHDAKTAAEAALRAALKRGGKSGTPVLVLPASRPSWAVPKPEAGLVAVRI